jgi:transposase
MCDKYLIMESIDKLEENEIAELENYLKEYKHAHNIYIRILAVRMVKLGQTRTAVGKYIHKDRKTVGKWIKDYDEYGIEGLIPDYSSCGTKSKLTDEQLSELKILLSNPDKHYTIIGAKELIEDKFEVTYSYKQVWEITRKKLGFNYCKPFLIYNEAPADAEDILLKKRQ